jgi:hypothetical protein
MWGHGLDRSGSKCGQVAGACICGNEPSGSVTYEEYDDWLRTGQLLKKDSAPWSEQVLRLGFPSSLFPSAVLVCTSPLTLRATIKYCASVVFPLVQARVPLEFRNMQWISEGTIGLLRTKCCPSLVICRLPCSFASSSCSVSALSEIILLCCLKCALNVFRSKLLFVIVGQNKQVPDSNLKPNFLYVIFQKERD